MPNQQTYNDLWVIGVLEGKRAGYYVEAGAVDGRRGADTDMLCHQYGWRGLLIEQNRRMFSHLEQNRKTDITVQCARSAVDKSRATFCDYPPPHGGWSRLQSETPVLALCNNFELDPERDASRYDVELRTLTSLPDEHAAPHTIDFLDLDIKTPVDAVFAGLDLTRFQFRCISTEGESLILQQHGYVLVMNPYCPDSGTRFCTYYYVNPGLVAASRIVPVP